MNMLLKQNERVEPFFHEIVCVNKYPMIILDDDGKIIAFNNAIERNKNKILTHNLKIYIGMNFLLLVHYIHTLTLDSKRNVIDGFSKVLSGINPFFEIVSPNRCGMSFQPTRVRGDAFKLNGRFWVMVMMTKLPRIGR